MARDYKNRGQRGRQQRSGGGVPFWRWLFVLSLIGGFVAFLVSLSGNEPAESGSKTIAVLSNPEPKRKPKPEKKKSQAPREKEMANVEPRFDFYTILPEDEVVIPDHEIKTTKRAESLGKAKPGSYILQAGSFRSFKEADKLKAQLALLGIEAKIETAKVGGATWNRIKIGPYANMTTVDKIRARLRENKIDVVVIKGSR